MRVNQGGPYGSAVLKGVQAESRAVWAKVVGGNGKGSAAAGPEPDVATVDTSSWLKAAIAVNPRAEGEGAWTCQAVVRSGSGMRRGTAFEFEIEALGR